MEKRMEKRAPKKWTEIKNYYGKKKKNQQEQKNPLDQGKLKTWKNLARK